MIQSIGAVLYYGNLLGLSWQIIPAGLLDLLYNPDAEASRRAMDSMLKMNKIDIEKVRQAYAGK